MLLCTIALVSTGLVLPARTPHTAMIPVTSTVSATPIGGEFNHIVMIAMENQNYGSVIGSSSAPFINSFAALGTTISNYHSYGQNIKGCSAGCYEAITSGQQSHSDGWCPRASSPCYTIPNIADKLHTAGLTSAMFCEDGCPRGADHFPWIAYTSTWNSCVTGSFTCNGQTGPDGNQLYGSLSSTGNSAFINYLNSPSPGNYIWFTPTDSHNMHDNSVSSGDAYLQNLLVGTGTFSTPSSGSVLSTNLFKIPGTFLYIWWDEYDPSPNVEFGSMIKIGYTSTGGYDEYDSLHTIETNWGLPYITSVVAGDSGLTGIFGGTPGLSLTASTTKVSVMQSFNDSITLTLASISGYAGTATITTTVLGAGVTTELGQSSVSLTSGSQQDVMLKVHVPSSAALGNYTITVTASTGTISKSLTISLRVVVPGDLDGDGIVSIEDVATMAIHYGETFASPNWDPYADLNHDGVIDMLDMATAAANYT